MIRLVICDMDGTIIGRDEQLPEGLPALISELKERGILFSIATGRSEAFMEPLIRRMGVDVPYVASNGATIMQNGQARLRKQFPIHEVRHILEMAQEMGMSLVFTSGGADRVIKITPWLMKEADKHGTAYAAEPFAEAEWESYCAEKVLIMDEVRDGRISIIEDMCKASLGGSFCYVRYRDKAVELMEKSANKAEGIREILAMLQIPVSDVLVIGDDDNDIQMFQLGAVSAAVGNASKNVLPYVNYHCKGNEFAGVQEAILKYCGV